MDTIAASSKPCTTIFNVRAESDGSQEDVFSIQEKSTDEAFNTPDTDSSEYSDDSSHSEKLPESHIEAMLKLAAPNNSDNCLSSTSTSSGTGKESSVVLSSEDHNIVVDEEIDVIDRLNCLICGGKCGAAINYCNKCWQKKKFSNPLRPCKRKRPADFSLNDSDSETDTGPKCVICYSEPAAYSLLHGKTMHQCVCRICGRKLFNSSTRNRRCPVCNLVISKMIKNVL